MHLGRGRRFGDRSETVLKRGGCTGRALAVRCTRDQSRDQGLGERERAEGAALAAKQGSRGRAERKKKKQRGGRRTARAVNTAMQLMRVMKLATHLLSLPELEKCVVSERRLASWSAQMM